MSKAHRGKYNVVYREKYLGENINKITYRSSWEKKFIQRLDSNDPNIIGWGSEVLSIKYKHPFTKTTKSYIPDFFIQYIDKNGTKKTEIVEIKPYCQTNPKFARSKYDKEQVVINMAKWSAAQAFCKKYGIGFRVLTEEDLFKSTKYSKTTKKPIVRRK